MLMKSAICSAHCTWPYHQNVERRHLEFLRSWHKLGETATVWWMEGLNVTRIVNVGVISTKAVLMGFQSPSFRIALGGIMA